MIRELKCYGYVSNQSSIKLLVSLIFIKYLINTNDLKWYTYDLLICTIYCYKVEINNFSMIFRLGYSGTVPLPTADCRLAIGWDERTKSGYLQKLKRN